jgi:hypothetical protein
MATTTSTQSNTGLSAAARPIDWPRVAYCALAATLVILGVAMLASELQVLPAEWARSLTVAGPVVVMLVGAALALWGWPGGRASLPAFALERGDVVCAELVAVTGGADLALHAYAGASQLAVGRFPNTSGPRVDLDGTRARLTLDPRLVRPHLAAGPWTLAVARGLPWDLDLRAGGGHLDLDLRGLSVAGLRVHSAFGNVALTLPSYGQAELKLRLALGDLHVTVPEGLEVRLRLKSGPLVRLTMDERRFVNVAPNEWMTPLYPTTTQRCTLLVDMSAGDLRLA